MKVNELVKLLCGCNQMGEVCLVITKAGEIPEFEWTIDEVAICPDVNTVYLTSVEDATDTPEDRNQRILHHMYTLLLEGPLDMSLLVERVATRACVDKDNIFDVFGVPSNLRD